MQVFFVFGRYNCYNIFITVRLPYGCIAQVFKKA